MNRRLVPSTALDAIGYDYGSQILQVTFRRDDGSLDTYYYHAVGPTTVGKLDEAESVGAAFNEHIRDDESLRVFKEGRDVESFGEVAATVADA